MAKSISKLNLFFNRDPQVGLPAEYDGVAPGSRWLLKKKSADLSSTCVPAVAGVGLAAMSDLDSDGSKECYSHLRRGTGAESAFLKPMYTVGALSGSDYLRTVVDLSGSLDADGLTWDINPYMIYGPTADKFFSVIGNSDTDENPFASSKVEIDPVTEIAVVTPLTLGPNAGAPILSGRTQHGWEKAGTMYFVGQRIDVNRDRFMLVDLTANAITEHILPASFRGIAGDWTNDDTGILYTMRNRSSRSTADLLPFDPAAKTFGTELTGIFDLGESTHRRSPNYETVQNDAYWILTFVVPGGSPSRIMVATFTFAGVLVDKKVAHTNYPDTRTRRSDQRIKTGPNQVLSSITSRDRDKSFKTLASVDAAGLITIDAAVVIDEPGNNAGGSNRYAHAHNTANNYIADHASDSRSNSGIILHLDDATLAKNTINVPVLMNEIAVVVADLTLNAVYPAMYIPNEDDAKPAKNVSVLVSNFVGGRFDGKTPDKGNFLIKMNDATNEEEETGFVVIESTEIVSLDSSCVLAGPGTMLSLKEVRFDEE